MNAKGLLLEFLNNGSEWPSPWSREWLHAPELKVYVRKGNRYVEGKKLRSLEIANIDVYKQGRGTFTDFFHFALSVCPYPLLIVECVQTEQFCHFFTRQGIPQMPDSLPPTFYCLNRAD